MKDWTCTQPTFVCRDVAIVEVSVASSDLLVQKTNFASDNMFQQKEFCMKNSKRNFSVTAIIWEQKLCAVRLKELG